MIRIRRSKVITLVAADAVRCLQCEITLQLIFVAAFTIHQGMFSYQRKLRIGMNGYIIQNFPTLKGVTFGTIIAHLCFMNIFVTGHTVLTDFAEILNIMAGLTGDFFVPILQSKICPVVIESNRMPGSGNMTCFTDQIFLLMRIFLRKHAGSCNKKHSL